MTPLQPRAKDKLLINSNLHHQTPRLAFDLLYREIDYL
jgi:hypothetical protein